MHAYLILAHHQFDLLQLLINAIDDARNHIYVHIDKKVALLPKLNAQYARLTIISERIDVRWADVSIVGAEYALFRAAAASDIKYEFYHLLSGVDLPIKSQNTIHSFFSAHADKQFIGYNQADYSYSVDRKVNRYHIFPHNFRDAGGLAGITRRVLRAGVLKLQYLTGYRRNKHVIFKKGTQWLSLTHAFVQYILQCEIEQLAIYHHTYCPDEIFIQTLCYNSEFKAQIYDIINEAPGCMRCINWKNNELTDWQPKDFAAILKSEAMFARKFNNKDMPALTQFINTVNSQY